LTKRFRRQRTIKKENNQGKASLDKTNLVTSLQTYAQERGSAVRIAKIQGKARQIHVHTMPKGVLPRTTYSNPYSTLPPSPTSTSNFRAYPTYKYWTRTRQTYLPENPECLSPSYSSRLQVVNISSISLSFDWHRTGLLATHRYGCLHRFDAPSFHFLPIRLLPGE
jgi:hypothetical protein